MATNIAKKRETTWHYMASDKVHTTYEVFLPKMKLESDQPQDLITSFQELQKTGVHVK